MKIKYFALILLLFFALLSHADDVVKNAVVQAGLLLSMALVLAVIVGSYKGGKALLCKVRPGSPLWMQKISGIVMTILIYSVWAIIVQD
jgi:hypothetical protein